MRSDSSKAKKYIEIGNRLRQIRGPLSQRELAKRIKVPFRTYQRYEAGENIPKGNILYRISAIYQMPIELILTGETKRSIVEDPASLKELIRLDYKKRKTNEDIARIDAILEKAYKELLERRFLMEGNTMEEIEEFLKSQPKPLHKQIEKVNVKPVKPSPLIVMIRQIERIYNEGNKIKINAIKSQLDALDPGERQYEKKSIK